MLPTNREPAHPGEMLLKEFLEPLGLSQKSFSDHIGWTYTRLNEIINKHRGITADSALTLAEAFQTEPEFWLNLQSSWDLWHSLKKHRKVKPLNLTRRAA
ncbi:addiction module antidote protein, HigA family [Rickettsiella grylli]|uniref:HigA family addiction module antitoxin n=1 Tax=Rickettsiella grylli TaxID=59196 RepID=UPI0008FD338B|nr:HigA family addiction module antitoxin [Rickettsiella grylli]OJA00947.1 addiction module antidote protein, HigA family [Rickettsiella grylli]